MKKGLTLISLAVILICGIYASLFAWKNIPITYDATHRAGADVTKIYEDPAKAAADVSAPDGVADVMVQQNLEKTMAANNVAAVVFDFRGFDTIGESFILLASIAGSFVILSRTSKKKEKEGKTE